jgi:hypothetical protein
VGPAAVASTRNLFFRPVRWIHRLTIYSGYGDVAAVRAVALSLPVHAASVRVRATALVAAYAPGSSCIFLAKTLIVRRAVKTMPEYRASLGGGGKNQGFWQCKLRGDSREFGNSRAIR